MIKVENLSMRYGGKILFKGLDLQLNPRCRYGLVGANGSGKSTFIKILNGEIVSESGKVHISSQLKLGSLKQDHFAYENDRIIDLVIRGDAILWAAIEKKNELLECEDFSDEHGMELGECEKVIGDRGGYAAESEAAKLLEGLGIQEKMHYKPLNALSGGYKLRVLLAQVLFRKPDILILDEPTNHLDLYSIKWLEGYLREYPGILVVSSHDRDFLNQVCNHIVDVDYGTMKIYTGNYDRFLEQKSEDRILKEAILSKHEKRVDDLQGFIDRFGAKASKARQAQSKARLVDKINEEMESVALEPSSRRYPKLDFASSRSSGVVPLKAEQIAKAYGPKQVLENITFEIERGDRLAIIGPNGIGKSTLLEILTGNSTSDRGSFNWGHGVEWAYFPQDHHREVKGDITLLEWIGQFDRSLPQEKLRDMLGRVLFSGDLVHQSVKTLSGGETARLILAKLMLRKPNVLIFDEPTNHLDMEAIDELVRAMEAFEGTILFVSHNRYFVSKIANRLFEITTEGIKDHRCTYQEYLSRSSTDHLTVSNSLKQRYEKEAVVETKSTLTYEEQKKLRNLAASNKKKLEQSEKNCYQLEEQISKLEVKMAEDGYFEKISRDEQIALTKQKQELEEKLKTSMEAWELLGKAES